MSNCHPATRRQRTMQPAQDAAMQCCFVMFRGHAHALNSPTMDVNLMMRLLHRRFGRVAERETHSVGVPYITGEETGAPVAHAAARRWAQTQAFVLLAMPSYP